MEFESVVGLEIHAQLLTQTKIFCGCPTAFGGAPNTHVCPVCLGLPGALPVLNRRAVELGVRAALALNCDVQPLSVFARKNYFYPDLPKGYQISQYDQPLAIDGRVEYDSDGHRAAVGIIRVHLEEDAGKSLHAGGSDTERVTHVDLNRSGVPLVEIVTHPDLRYGAEAADFFARLRAILQAVEVNDGNMEEGSLRCDANVSVRPVGDVELGVKVEVKNINSFRFLRDAIDYEFARQVDIVRRGGQVIQETRLWDSSSRRTESMRSKEDAHDYRYFPEPDLPPVEVSEAWVDEVRQALPELPDDRRRRFVEEFRLPEYDAGVLTHSVAISDYFEEVARASANPKAASNWVMGEVARATKSAGVDIAAFAIRPPALADLIAKIDGGAVSGSAAKQVFERMVATGETATQAIDAEGLAQMDDPDALGRVVASVLEAHPQVVANYRAGKTGVIGFLVGQVMRESQGRANPKVVNDLLRLSLGSS